MEAIASVIAVLGTLLGVAITQRFQRRALQRTEEFARREKMRQERLDAYSAYAGSLVNYRRSLVHRWFFEHEQRTDEEEVDVRRRAYDFRSQAQDALFRVEMLTDDEGLIAQARGAFERISLVHKAQGRDEMDARRDETRREIDDFVKAAKAYVAG
ncbi:hypothetical protein ACFQVC_19025 [Streptomyces monticola]|uniref:Secreted protein n=1 Tax=Streptomyces monticola TaxID=2666263 RepID=A0ABW2JLG6_9ACTN